MTAYQLITFGTFTISDIVSRMQIQHEAIRGHEAGSVEPSVKTNGLLWLNTTSGKYERFDPSLNGGLGGWYELFSASVESLAADGSVALIADLPAGSFKITGLGPGSADTDAANVGQVVLRTGGQLSGSLDANTNTITNLAAPVNDNDAARKVDARSIGDGLAHFNQTTTQWQGTAGADFERCGPNDANSFVPREIAFMLDGAITLQAGGAGVGTIVDPEQHRTNRWENFNSPSDPATPFVVASFDVAATTFELCVAYKFDAGVLGFYAFLRRQSDAARCDVAVFQTWAMGRVDA